MPATITSVQTLPTLSEIIILCGTVGAVVWGILEAAKALLRGAGRSSPWYDGALKLVALMLGAALGTPLYAVLGNPGWPWGTALGAGAGALCAFIVALIKARGTKITNT